MDYHYLISYNHIVSPHILPDFYIYQVGRIVCSADTFYPNHYHDSFFELTIVTGGEGFIFTNNTPTRVEAGDIYFSCPHDIHSIRPDKQNPLTYDFCAFYPKDESLKNELETLSAKLTEQNRLFHSNRISYLCPLAIGEMQNPDKGYSPIVLNSIFWQISVYLLRILNGSNLHEVKHVDNKNILCYRMMDYITSHIDDLSSLTVLSETFRYSYNYLSKIFKEVTSMTLINFYNMQRLSIAAKMILENEHTLEFISKKTNFSTSYALSKAFKKAYGVSPREYRNRSKSDALEMPFSHRETDRH